MQVINGKWHIYDIATDDFKEMTKEDVESLERQSRAFSMIMTAMQYAQNIDVKDLRRRALQMAQGRENPDLNA